MMCIKPVVSGTTALLAAAAVSLALAGCSPRRAAETAPGSDLPIAQVRTQTVENKARTITEEVVGTLRARLRATLEARVSGRIETMPVALGEQVRKGQSVARLDAGEIAARLAQSEAALEQAERDWKRISTLFEQQSATRAEYDSARARQQVASAAVAEARAMMGYVDILAPFDGVVTRKWVDTGDLALPGKPLLTIEDPSALQIEADVPEAIASHIQRDSRLAVHVDAVQADLVGVVTEIAPSADPASRTFRVKLDLPLAPGLMPGQFARLSVPIGESDSVRVPVSAVVQRGQLEIVFTIQNQHARLHLVKTGKRVGEEIEVLSGLEAGQTVVVSGATQLTDGQPVEAK
jgi:RND family efflux transporter MFP subunit